MKSFFRKISLYWYCQFFGWGAALLYWSYYSLTNGLSWPLKLFQLLVPFGFAIYSTHLYKNWAHRKGILALKIEPLIPKMMVALFILSLGYLVSSFLVGSLVYQKWIFSALPGMISGGVRYMAIWLLAFHLYHYAKRESNLETEKSQLEALAWKAQLDALSHELNPHFLFNALNSIKSLVYENPELADRAIVKLSELLRYALRQSSDSLTTIKKEMEAVKDYLEMEGLRLEERLRVELQVEDDTLAIKIPTLSLLSLVENAVKHGIAVAMHGGVLKVSIKRIEDKLQINISNPGTLQTESAGGSGNSNLRSRIKILYPERASLQLQQAAENLILTRLTLPIQK